MDIRPESITNQANGNSRNERSGKGRRRRAAAEQRRIEQERWGEWLTTPNHNDNAAEGEDEDEPENEEVYTSLQAPTRTVRRRNRRRKNRQGAALHLDQLRLEVDYYMNENLDSPTFDAEDRSHGSNSDDYDMGIALAVSLSLSQSGNGSSDQNAIYSGQYGSNLSYERLTPLENVRCVAPAAIVNSLSVNAFVGNKASEELVEPAEVCAICQCEYESGDPIMSLPCTHGFHHHCGSQWLLNYSKLCPICKLDVVEQHEG